MDTHIGYAERGGDKAFFDGEGAHTGEDIAAVLPRIDPWLGRDNLQEEIIDICVGPRRARYDRDLAGQGVGAAHAVNLPGIGRAHGRQQHGIAGRGVLRQIVAQEIKPLGRAAAHDGAGNGCLHRHHTSSIQIRPFSAKRSRIL